MVGVTRLACPAVQTRDKRRAAPVPVGHSLTCAGRTSSDGLEQIDPVAKATGQHTLMRANGTRGTRTGGPSVVGVRQIGCGTECGGRGDEGPGRCVSSVPDRFAETLVRIRVRISLVGCDQPRGPSRSSVGAKSPPRPGRPVLSRAPRTGTRIVAPPEDTVLRFAPPVSWSTAVATVIGTRLAIVRDAASSRTGERSLPTGFATAHVRSATGRPSDRVSRAEASCLRDHGCRSFRRLSVVDARVVGEAACGVDNPSGCRGLRGDTHALATAV